MSDKKIHVGPDLDILEPHYLTLTGPLMTPSNFPRILLLGVFGRDAKYMRVNASAGTKKFSEAFKFSAEGFFRKYLEGRKEMDETGVERRIHSDEEVAPMVKALASQMSQAAANLDPRGINAVKRSAKAAGEDVAAALEKYRADQEVKKAKKEAEKAEKSAEKVKRLAAENAASSGASTSVGKGASVEPHRRKNSKEKGKGPEVQSAALRSLSSMNVGQTPASASSSFTRADEQWNSLPFGGVGPGPLPTPTILTPVAATNSQELISFF